jgi:heptosyltransferase-2
MPGTLIVRLPNWLGDTVMAVPALRALRAGHAQARMALVGPWVTLLAGQGLADVLIPYPRSWAGRIARWDAVRALDVETVVLLPNSFESAVAAWYWRATRCIGFDAGGRRRLLTDAIPMPAPRRHQVDEYLVLAERLAPCLDGRIPGLAAPPPESPERVTVRRLLGMAGVSPGGGPVVGVHLGAAYGASKLWPVDRIVQLCRLLADRGQVPVLLGAPGDLDVARAVARETGARSLVGQDNPELLTALLAELDMLVCGDTGVGHLAAALGTPVVALFGPTDPRLSAPRGKVHVIVHPVPCAPCFYRTCPIDHPCLRGVEATDVHAAIEDVLAVSVRGGAR